ncbi:MAG: CDP-glycerol glycerophosphotransferase family protein [Clostridiales bacterium]|nr:CDP-glycerol glycerophosphotransferase family protein [Clostridiales bacterium]
MAKYPFSTILYVDHEELFEAALSNLMSNGLDDAGVQLIVVDPYASEKIRQACERREETLYLPLQDAELPAAYQEGLERAEGEYLSFTLASSTYTANVYQNVSRAFERFKTDLVDLRAFFVDEQGGQTPYGGSSKPGRKAEQVDLCQTPHRIQLLLQSYFFRRKSLRGRAFRTELHEDALYQFVLETLLETPNYFYLRHTKYCYTVPLEDNTSLNPLQYHPWWYHQSVNDFMIPLLKKTKEERGSVPQFLQVACLYLLYAKFNCNFNDRNKGVLKTREEAGQFLNEAFQALTYIDNDILMSSRITDYVRTNRSLRGLLLRGKAEALGKRVQVVDTNGYYVALFEPKDGGAQPDDDYDNRIALLGRSDRELLRIRVMNYEDGVLHIDANVGIADFLRAEEYSVYAVSTKSEGGKRKSTVYQPDYLQIYPLTKCFGVTFMRKNPVQFHIPVSKSGTQTIQFFCSYRGKEEQLKLTFDSYNSRMSADNPYSYWIFRKGWMVTWSEKSTLTLRKYNGWFHLRRELLFAWNLFRTMKDKKVAARGLLLRFLYWLTLPYYSKKHIWVTYDKQYKAGDNGEYMYQYCRANHSDEVEIYYSVRKDSPDYQRMVKEDKKHILPFGALHSQLIWLMAELILNTHANVSAQYNPIAEYRDFTKDLQRGDSVCIQHGLTIQKIAQYQNRTFDNTKLYCCASPYEVENLSGPFYGYQPETLKLVGLARYDGLKSRDQRIILITPSWRRNVVNSGIANIRKTHNNNFKESSYFRIYNALINDQTLIDCAKAHGYRIVYLLHPAMSAQIDDFDRNDYVELVPATGDVSYEKILCESSLMVTDYSGVQFDFAYMRKPIIYYHPAELPPHYDEGGLIYSTMGFGPICTDHAAIVAQLCAAMERNCQTEAEYIRRADDFFAFSDHNNCQRIYEAIRDWQKQRG